MLRPVAAAGTAAGGADLLDQQAAQIGQIGVLEEQIDAQVGVDARQCRIDQAPTPASLPRARYSASATAAGAGAARFRRGARPTRRRRRQDESTGAE